MEQSLCPRIIGSQLPTFQGRNVTMILETAQASGETVIGRTSDSVEVQVRLPPGERIESRYFQVIGKVAGRNVVEARSVQGVSDNFDMAAYNAAVELMHGKHRNLFF